MVETGAAELTEQAFGIPIVELLRLLAATQRSTPSDLARACQGQVWYGGCCMLLVESELAQHIML